MESMKNIEALHLQSKLMHCPLEAKLMHFFFPQVTAAAFSSVRRLLRLIASTQNVGQPSRTVP
jgi:hypothetical protein